MEGSAEGLQSVLSCMEERFKMPIPKAWLPIIEGWLEKYPAELIKDAINRSAEANMKSTSYIEAVLKRASQKSKTLNG